MFSLYLKYFLCFEKKNYSIYLFPQHNKRTGGNPLSLHRGVSSILFLTHVLLYTLFVLSQVVCKQFVSIFLSLLENDERYAEWNTTIIILSCFCKSATGCVVCINRAVVDTVVPHIDIPRLSPVRTVCCVPYDTITPVSRHVLSVSRAPYMELHFHVLVIVRRDYHFRIKCLFLHERISSIINTLLLHRSGTYINRLTASPDIRQFRKSIFSRIGS